MGTARRTTTMLVLLCAGIGATFVALDRGETRAADDKVDVHRLPLGDGHVSTTSARRGWVYACQVMSGGGGAFQDGPWIRSDGTFDLTAKATVDGSVAWPSARVRISRSGRRVRITGNGLPVKTTTG